jgi:hypothetical protein
MDEEERRYWDGVMVKVNTKLDDILDKLAADRADIDSTRGHLIYGLSESLTLSQRISKLEEAMRSFTVMEISSALPSPRWRPAAGSAACSSTCSSAWDRPAGGFFAIIGGGGFLVAIPFLLFAIWLPRLCRQGHLRFMAAVRPQRVTRRLKRVRVVGYLVGSGRNGLFHPLVAPLGTRKALSTYPFAIGPISPQVHRRHGKRPPAAIVPVDLRRLFHRVEEFGAVSNLAP